MRACFSEHYLQPILLSSSTKAISPLYFNTADQARMNAPKAVRSPLETFKMLRAKWCALISRDYDEKGSEGR